MENVGKWNSDLVIFYSLIFFSPMMLYFLMGVFIRIAQLSSSINTKVVTAPAIKHKVKTQKPKIKVVYVEKNIQKPTKNTQDRPIEPIVQTTDKTDSR